MADFRPRLWELSVMRRGSGVWIIAAIFGALILGLVLIYGLPRNPNYVPLPEADESRSTQAEVSGQASLSTPTPAEGTSREREAAKESVVPPTPVIVALSPEAKWALRYDKMSRDELSGRIKELADLFAAQSGAVFESRFASGQYEVISVEGVDVPPASDGFIASARRLVEGGPVPVVHYVPLMAADYPELADIKKELDWLHVAMHQR